MTGRLVLMGSGELAPTMVATHRAAVDSAGATEVVVLDSPFGFQENVDVLTRRIVDFFTTSLRCEVRVASLRTIDEPAAQVERMLATVGDARYVFAGPGSPSYALAIWRRVGLAERLRSVLAGGGAVTLASAAALTAGIGTIPVYEIYKVGADPAWLPGLDLGGPFGLRMTVVPHWNNAEGGNHDTSRCYIGRRRLAMLEPQLDHGIVGVDEHTAAVIDFESGSLTVTGNSTVTLRGSREVVLESGSVLDLGEVREILSGAATAPAEAPAPAPDIAPDLDAALGSGDADAALEAALAIEDRVAAGTAARTELRTAVAKIASAAESGLEDPRVAIAGHVELLLELRATARREGRYEDGDLIRDGLEALGVEVRDTPGGVEWHLR